MTLSRSDRDQLYAAKKLERRIKRKARREARIKRLKEYNNPKADRGRVRDRAFLAWLRRQPCAVGPIGCSGPIEAAHIRFPRPGEPPTGLQRKPDDRRATPLCAGHHRHGPDAQHRENERAWWGRHNIDPHALADQLYAEFQNG